MFAPFHVARWLLLINLTYTTKLSVAAVLLQNNYSSSNNTGMYATVYIPGVKYEYDQLQLLDAVMTLPRDKPWDFCAISCSKVAAGCPRLHMRRV